MWYEIIPAFGIIVASVAAPHGVAYLLNKLVAGNFYRRELLDRTQMLSYLRDVRLTNDAYVVNGLEAIPDDDDDDTENGDKK